MYLKGVSVVLTALALGAGCASGPSHEISVPCQVQLAGKGQTVRIVTRVGNASAARVGGYTVTFSIRPKSQLHVEIEQSNTGQFVMTADTGFISSGSSRTADGELFYECSQRIGGLATVSDPQS